MAWDKNKPLGTTNVRQVDNDIRDNNDALENALNVEHAFVTGGASGVHRFQRGSAADRDSAFTSPANGSVFMRTTDLGNTRAGPLIAMWEMYAAGAWKLVSDMMLSLTGNLWERAQWGYGTNLGNLGASLDPVAHPGWDIRDSSYYLASADQDVTIELPANIPAINQWTSWVLVVNNSVPSTITFATDYKFQGGVAPVLGQGIHRIVFTSYAVNFVLTDVGQAYS